MQLIDNIYLIKDLSRLSGHSIYTIKFYLKLGLIKETGRSPQTRFRYFDDSTVAQLSQIRAWRKARKSLAEIQRLQQLPSALPGPPLASVGAGGPQPSARSGR